MRLRALRPMQGICFAWLPVWTDEGKVWLEHVHYKWDPGWGWGSSGCYRYRRVRYKNDAFGLPMIANFDDERKLSGVKAYATPPGDPRIFCRNFNPDGPTPCHYPHCLVGGMDNCGVCIGRDIVAP